MRQVLDMINCKCWYYDAAIARGSKESLKTITPGEMPEEIRAAWLNAHRNAEENQKGGSDIW